MSLNIGQRIADPRSLSDELAEDVNTMYSGLATYTFGSPRSSSQDALAESSESISPLTAVPRRTSIDRTPRPSVSAQFHNVSSHPSQGVGLPTFSLHPSPVQSRRHSATRLPSLVVNTSSRSRVVSGSDSENRLDPTPHSDHSVPTYFSSQRGSVMPDNASQHTFGRASRTHGVTAALSHDGPIPSSSSASVTTSRSSSRASMRTTTEQFSSDDELEIDCYDGSSSPVTFARDYLVDIDEDLDFVDPGPSSSRLSVFDGRRGSLPMAIPGAVQSSDVYSNRSREGSILTVRRASRSLDDSSTHRSSLCGEDPTIYPKSEPTSRAGRISLEHLQASQQQVVEPNAYDGLNLQYILSRRSEGSIRSFNSRLSFVQGSVSGAGRASQQLSAIAPFASGSTTAFGDTFTTHLQINDREWNTVRYFWSFQREKADATSSMRRRQQQAHHRPDKPVKEGSSRTQEMWRCGHVGRFKVDKLVFKPQSADPTKGAQQRIHVRHIPDPFLMGNTISGPHSVIHKHSRAVAFSIFRSYSIFSGRQANGLSAAQTHMNMRSGTMLALKKVQEQYTSTRTTRQLGPFQTGDKKSGDSKEDKERGSRRGTRSLSSRDKEKRQGQEKGSKDKGKGKASSKSKGKDKKHRVNPTASTESSTATSSAGSVSAGTTSAVQQMVSSTEQPEMRIQLSPSISSTSVYHQESLNRPVSSASSISPSMSESIRTSENEMSLAPPIRRHRDHRDSIDSDDRWPTRTGTTHAEAFSKLDPNDIETLRAKASSRTHTDSGSTFTERLIRVFLRGSSKSDDHSLIAAQPKAFQPPWMTTAGRDQQEENDRVLDDLNASFRDVGLLHTNHHKPSRGGPKHKPSQSVLDQIRDDCLYMLLPLWPGETDANGTQTETSSTTSVVPIPENRQFLLVYYVPFSEASSASKKAEKKKAKHSHSSESGTELDAKAVYLPTFRVVARVVTYDELQPSGVRIPSEGLATNGPEWEAVHYAAAVPRDGMPETVVCQCEGRERGFDFQQDGLLKLGLCTREELPVHEDMAESEEDEREVGRIVLTPIGRAAVEMIWLGCLAITSFGPTSS